MHLNAQCVSAMNIIVNEWLGSYGTDAIGGLSVNDFIDAAKIECRLKMGLFSGLTGAGDRPAQTVAHCSPVGAGRKGFDGNQTDPGVIHVTQRRI